MNRYKKLASDTVIMTIGSFSSKVLVFLLLPIYTYVLSTEEYGIADLFLTTVSLLIPILTLSISESTFRFSFDKNVDQAKNITTSLILVMGSAVILIPVTLILSVWNNSFHMYFPYFIALYLFSALNTCMSNYARGTNHVKIFVGASVVYTAFLVSLNILFLTVIKLGLEGYLIALIISYASSSATVFLALKCWRLIKLDKVDAHLLKEMLSFSIPMIFSTTAWWAMNSIDKYMLIDWYGIETSGLYGVAQKLPTIISMFSSIFVQAWQISAISSYGEKDSSEFYTNVYRVYEVGLYIVAGGLVFMTKPLASIMFQKEYFQAYIYAPVLLIAGVFSCFTSFLTSPFVAEKKSGALLKTTLIGLFFNLIANVVLMKLMGPIGATYATMLGFGVTWYVRLLLSRKFISIEVNWFKTIVSLILLFSEALIITYNIAYGMIIAFGILITLLFLHFKTIKLLFNSLFEIVKNHFKKQ